jgi:hypothetical protein
MFLKIFPPLIDEIRSEFWNEFNEFKKERHKIIHEPKRANPIICNPERIENALREFENGIKIVDKRLFTSYPSEYMIK